MAFNEQVIYASSSVVGAIKNNAGPTHRSAWLEFGPGRLRKLVYNAFTTAEEIHDSIVVSGGKTPETHAAMIRTRAERNVVVINADMPPTTFKSPYMVEFIRVRRLLETGEKLAISQGMNVRDLTDIVNEEFTSNNNKFVHIRHQHEIDRGFADRTEVQNNTVARSEEKDEALSLQPQTWHQHRGITLALLRISQQFEKAFYESNKTRDFLRRLDNVDQRQHTHGLRKNEIEICQNEVSRLREELNNSMSLQNNDLQNIGNNSRRSSTPSLTDVVGGATYEPPLYTKYRFSSEVLSLFKQPSFDVWNWEEMEMLSFLEYIFTDLNIFQAFEVNLITFRRWVRCVSANYRTNPFHNFRHCFCVTQMFYVIVHLCKLQDRINIIDLAATLVACVCHDVDHPGYNNAYHISARTELSVKYDDDSPLENHHCAVTAQILKVPECDIFEFVDIDTRTRLSRDIRPTNISEQWLSYMNDEYCNQNDQERALGLTLNGHTDRIKVTRNGFITCVLLPGFELLSEILPEIRIELMPLIENALLRKHP